MRCENCKEELTGKKNFCSNCGQKRIPDLNLKYIFTDFVDNYFYFDSKLFKSIGSLLIRPGKLSYEFLQGKRKSYLPPARLYVTLSVLFFFLITFSSSLPVELEREEIVKPLVFSYDDKEVIMTPEKYEELEISNGFDAYIQDSLQIEGQFGATIVRKMMDAQYDGKSFKEAVINQTSIFLLLFIPFMALIYKLTFYRNKYGYVKHMVFNIHFNSFIMMLLIFNKLVSVFTDSYLRYVAIIVLSIGYLFIALKRFYDRKWWVIIYKMIFLFFGYSISALFFTLIIFFMSLILY